MSIDQDPGLWAVLYRERFGITPPTQQEDDTDE